VVEIASVNHFERICGIVPGITGAVYKKAPFFIFDYSLTSYIPGPLKLSEAIVLTETLLLVKSFPDGTL
jgi:hypothetical protein